MLYLRPQRVYKPSALSYLGDPSDIVDSIIDRYLNKDLYRLRIETPRDTSITADNSQITCYAHIFDKEDGSELTDLLKGRGFRPTWLLDGKPIDSTRISEEGYQITLETDHLPAIYQTVTLQVRDTDILLALTTDEIQKRIYSQLIELGSIPTNLLKTSEKLLNISRLDKIRVEGLEEIKQDLSKALAGKLATSQQQAVAEAVKQAEELDKQIKVGGRNLIRNSDKSLSNSDYYVVRYEISDPSLMVAGEDYTIRIWGEIDGADYSESIWVYNSGGNTEVANIQKIVNGVWQMTFKWIDDSGKLNSHLNLFRGANHPNNKNSYNTTIIRIKLERGTVSTDWTPAPEDLDDSISKVNKSLTSLASTLLDPDQGEIHKLTSQLATSQQQAVDEAVRQAGEMDKQLKVGGRNLIKTLRGRDGSVSSMREITVDGDALLWKQLDNSTQPYSLYLHAPLTDGDYTLSYKCSVGENYRDFIYYSRADNGNGFSSSTTTTTKIGDGVWLHTATFRGLTASKYKEINFYGTDPFDPAKEVRFWDIKLERGTIATDWTPAPEDVAESVSKVSKSLMELSDHPLTVDENGFWKIWSVKDGAYKTTQYQSRGEAGRYLGRAKRIHPDLNGNYLLETENSWRTAKEGDYVYLVGDAPNRGGVKDTYYIVREHTSKTVWEVYNIKGRVPVLTLDSQHHLLADGKMVSMQSLKGEAGHSTSPEDVLGNEHFRQLLDSSVTTAVGPRLSQSDLEIDNAFKYIQAISNKLDSTYKIDITTSGYVTARCEQACSYVAKGTAPEHMPTCHIPGSRPQIRIALRSDFDTLKRQVDSLSARINQLEDSANITPVLDTTLRRRPSLIDKSKVTLYPLYGDWILTSDVDDQYISFSGLSAEVGKSIYIQTRRKAYLYANNHSFYGLPGTSSSIAVNQWLAKNTTYRFVRASSDSWLVTASSSPYPWT